MILYAIPYEDRYGRHETHKWANDPKEARDLIRKSKPTAEVGMPYVVIPQPFERNESAQQQPTSTNAA